MKSAEDDNFRFMSNSTVVVLACLWMVGGALMHYWRFGAASEEVRAIVDERSRTAAGNRPLYPTGIYSTRGF